MTKDVNDIHRELGTDAARALVDRLPDLDLGEPVPPNGDARAARGTSPPERAQRTPKPIVLPPCATPYEFPNAADIPPRAWLYGGHYIRGVATATIAPGGHGKTTISLFEAITMAFNGLRVWYLSGEDPKVEIDRRIAAHCQHHQLDQSKITGKLFVDDRETYPLVLATEGKNQVLIFDENQLAAFEGAIKRDNIDVTILDPLISFHAGGETNSVFDRIVKRINRICVAQDCNIEFSHHSRKIAPGQELTVDDARGGGALVNAVRSCRVINRMTTAEAEQARIAKKDRTRHLRVDNGKRNMAPPEDAKWMRLVSVHLPNGDNVQAIEFWEFPKTFASVAIQDQDWVRTLVRNGDAYRTSSQSPDWLGHELAKHFDRDVTVKGDVIWVSKVLKAWVENKVLIKVKRPDAHREMKEFYALGEPGEEPNETEA